MMMFDAKTAFAQPRLESFIKGVAGKRLTYAALIARIRRTLRRHGQDRSRADQDGTGGVRRGGN